MSERQGHCFVIMPFTVKEADRGRYQDPNHWNEVYEGLIVPAIDGAGLSCQRDDKDTGARLIVESILEKIEHADLVLCDLSSHNANVFLELGWALRADRPFVLIKDDLTQHTFDLNQQFTYEYQHSLRPINLQRESEELAQAIQQTMGDSEKRSSIVRRLSLSLSAIKASKEGDLQVRLLTDIQRSLAAMQGASLTYGAEQGTDFPWPSLLSKANACLQAFIELFDGTAGSIPALESMNELAMRLDVEHRREIQVSVVGSDRNWVFHEWSNFIGSPVGIPGANSRHVLDDIFLRSCGAVAWVDRASNLHRERGVNYKRFNIGVFSLHSATGCRIMVETHHETA